MQKTTLFLVLLALGLGGYVYFSEIQSSPPEETTTTSEETLFNFEQNEVRQLTIEREEETLTLIRSDEGWEMTEPEEVMAKESAIVFLLDLLTTEASSETFTVESDQLENYQLNDPLATIKLQLEDETENTIMLGKTTFNEEEVYAQINPEADTMQEVKIIPVDLMSAVERPLSEWKEEASEEEEEETNSD
ncbi:MAG: DUF4340 domain-containing protein [Halothece sp.]